MRNRIKITGVLASSSGKSDTILVHSPEKRVKRSRPKVDTKSIAIGGLSFLAYLLKGQKGKVSLSELRTHGNIDIAESKADRRLTEVSDQMDREFNKGRVRVIGTATRLVRKGYTTQVTR